MRIIIIITAHPLSAMSRGKLCRSKFLRISPPRLTVIVYLIHI